MAGTGSGVADYPVLVITLIVGATVLVLVYISSLLKSSKEENVKSSEEVPKKKQKESSGSNLKPSKKKQHGGEKWVRETKQSFSHPWLLTSLKGHSGDILDMDFSSNGKFLATCAEDRAVFIWNTKDWNQKEHKSLRMNVEFDHARFIKFSPDGKAFIILKAKENHLEVYKVTKRPDGLLTNVTKSASFPKLHEDEVIGLGIACNGKFMMSCSEKNELVVCSLKGQVWTTVDTYLVTTFCARISPCARFIVASGFAPDAKVWEVKFTKTGEFQQVVRAFELCGHTAGIYDVSFSSDSSRMVTVSKDGTWRAYNTRIEYEKGEDPHLLSTGKYTHMGPSHIVMSPDGEVVVVSSGSSIAFYSVQSGACDKVIDNVYSGDIYSLAFDALGKFVLTAGEKHVRVFHNVTGYKTTIAIARAKLHQSVSSAQKERMEQQIKEAGAFLRSIGAQTR